MLYIVVISYPPTAYSICGDAALNELTQKLLTEQTSFKVYPLLASNTPITPLDIWYEPHYNYVYLYPLREESKFKTVYETKAEQTVWFQGNTMMTPPWFNESGKTHHELMISAVHEISRRKEKTKQDFLVRTYDKAPDVGSVDSEEQFEKRFPNEDPKNFSFRTTGSHDLICRYGNYQRWHKSGYEVPYYGNQHVYEDCGFTVFPETFYEFRRKPPSSKEEETNW